MSVQPNNTDGYCSPSDVARYFRTLEDGFDFDTNPTKDDVDEWILEATARIDRETGHAWRERTVENEYHDLDNIYYWDAGTPVALMQREIRTPLDNTQGDKIELWDGNEWDEWVSDASLTEGRDNDYWVNEPDGILYLYDRAILHRYKRLRVTYRFGGTTIPKDIQKATAMFTAADLLRTDVYGDLLPSGGGDAPSPESTADNLDEQAMRILERRREVRTI